MSRRFRDQNRAGSTRHAAMIWFHVERAWLTRGARRNTDGATVRIQDGRSMSCGNGFMTQRVHGSLPPRPIAVARALLGSHLAHDTVSSAQAPPFHCGPTTPSLVRAF